jgi:putative peptide zinc metalloprotease protein
MLSNSWYRVADLQPRLRSQVRLYRHHYRGERWYILQNESTRSCHRLSRDAQLLIGFMDGRRTVHEVWEIASERLGDDVPTQDETIRLLGLLHFADALRCDVSPDTAEMFRRSSRRTASDSWKRFLNPLSLRFKLVNPDRFLTRTMPWVQPLFSRWGAMLWFAVVTAALVLGASHWSEIVQDPASTLLSGNNLLLLWIVYPCVKALHELGHGFAAKAWGAEIHEMGILFMVLMPVPYVDASAASVFPDKRKRMLVGAAGIIVEVFLAGLALLVWLAVEPGIIRSIAYNVMWIGGLSTLLFNGNPLIRFDGYYVFSDAIEIPNLAARSSSYLGYLVQRHAFGMRAVRNPVAAKGEPPWFFAYGIASYAYRFMLTIGIALFIAGKFFAVGIMLAVLSLTTQIALPVLRQLQLVLFSPRFGENRPRVAGLLLGCFSVAAAIFLFLPIPLHTMAEGVVWLPEDAQIRAGEDGFVKQVLVPTHSQIQQGDPILLLAEPLLVARVAVLEAELRALQARHYAQRSNDVAQAQISLEEIDTVAANLARARSRQRETVVRSTTTGTVVIPQVDDLPGRFIRKGETIGYVINEAGPNIRVAIRERDIAMVRDNTQATQVRLASRITEVWPAQIERHVPAASRHLPTPALGTMGGGEWLVDPSDIEGLTTLIPVFQLDLRVTEKPAIGAIGERVYVRFEHGAEPMALRAYRDLRRLLLRHLDV